MKGFKAALCASILMAPACLASARDGMPPLPPLPSPDGQYLLSPYTMIDSEEVEIWIIRITDTTGHVVMSLLGPDFSTTYGLYRAWDDMGRAWVYSEALEYVSCYSLTSSGWREVYWNESGKDEVEFIAPYDLHPQIHRNRRGDPPEMIPERLYENSGPGWEFSLYMPAHQSDVSFLRSLVWEVMWPRMDRFSAEAESSFAEWGDDPGYMNWSLEIRTSFPRVPEGMLAVACDWWDYTGGAHGNGGGECWLFDHDEESITSLPWTMIGTRDLLADSAELVALSALVVDSLAESLGEFADMGWIMEGAGPEWGNYGDLMPVPDSRGALAGFRIWFPDYRVAPYVAGPQEVFIPIELLRP